MKKRVMLEAWENIMAKFKMGVETDAKLIKWGETYDWKLVFDHYNL